MHTDVHTHLHTCTYAHADTGLYTQMWACMHAHAHMHTRARTHERAYTNIIHMRAHASKQATANGSDLSQRHLAPQHRRTVHLSHRVRACVRACVLACVLACMHACLHACLCDCVLACVVACMCAHVHQFSKASMPRPLHLLQRTLSQPLHTWMHTCEEAIVRGACDMVLHGCLWCVCFIGHGVSIRDQRRRPVPAERLLKKND